MYHTNPFQPLSSTLENNWGPKWHLYDTWSHHLWVMPITHGNKNSFENKLEWQRWIFRYVENKIGKTQATPLTYILLIPSANTFTTFSQVSSYMHTTLFGIIQDTSDIPYIVTKLLPLSLGCTKSTFTRNITKPFTPPALPIKKNSFEKLYSMQIFSW